MAKGVILNEDLLWMIFTLVAEDDQKNMSNRLQCVLNGTHVCRQWRMCLLSATNVWGRLIFVDSNRPREKKPTLELLELVAKRSGNTSPLFIEATATRHGVDTGLRLFLCQLMKEAWERIQEIHFELIDDTRDQQIRKRTRAVIARPAPNLRIFRVYGSDFNITHDNDFMFILNKYDKLFSEGVYPADRAVPPFANFAPRLEEFFVGHIYFPQQAAWLSGLRSLVVAYDCNALWIAYRSLPQLLEALQSMPRLESLECRLQDFHRRESPQEGKYVDLPNLKYMLLSAHPDICTFLRDHIRGAQTGCLLHLELMVDEYLESDGSNFMSLGDVFSTTLQRNMALASPPAQHITSMTMFLCDYRMVFHLKLQSARFGTIPTIRFDHYPGCERKENQGLLVALLSVFSHFKDITTLKLGRLDMGNYYIKCLLSMTSVTTLEAWFSGTLYWLTFIR
ncbi:hypothetical protein D9613_004656 [Agrocybe pediades]|uniref:F-box domain-containing protein n=1 Tax=Agrocybe pediades TaxID=84607 RepID=A0A8H4VRJ6_9AGAR|nr:hypothetical protein D9613_004656 [Agrocybe pediades]